MRRSRLTLSAAASLIALTAVAAYAAAGDFDTSFSGDGTRVTNYGGPHQGANAIVVDPDGKMVVAGWWSPASFPDQFAIARFLPNGQLDASFSGDGKVRTAFTGRDATAQDLALTPSGKIVVVGNVSDDGFGVVRYNADGSLDSSFSGDGKRTIDFGGDFQYASGVVVTPTEKIVVAGTSYLGPNDPRIAIARMTPSGGLDPTFGAPATPGKRLTLVDDGVVAADVARVGGKFVVAATGQDNDLTLGSPPPNFLLAQYTSGGDLDTTFGGGDGWVTTTFSNHVDSTQHPYELLVTPDGRLVVAGVATFDHEPYGDHAVIARFKPNGSLDPTFSGDGKATYDYGAYETAVAIARQPDGKLVLAGRRSRVVGETVEVEQMVLRVQANGQRDRSFDGDGMRTFTVVGSGYQDEGARGVAIHDGKIVVVGAGFDEEGDTRTAFTTARLLGD